MAGAAPDRSPPTPSSDAPGHDQRPLVYFFCLGNAMRSQMAEAFLRQRAGQHFRIASAGTRPLGFVLPEVIQVMREKDLDLRLQRSTGIDSTLVAEATYLVDLGCHVHEHIPSQHLHKLLVWPVQDAYGMGMGTLRSVRDQIEELIQGFVARHLAEAPTPVGSEPQGQ